MSIVAEVKEAGKVYHVGNQEIVALQPSNLTLNEGELLLIIGPSGSGKTTLLSLLGCVIYPTMGKIFIDNQEVSSMKMDRLAKLRLNTIGFVFQNFNLLAPLTSFENVLIPLQLQKIPLPEAKKRTMEALEKVGMTTYKNNLPKQLSGGQQQRVAIARALVTRPKIVLCDEPTASLDKDSLAIVMEDLRELTLSGKSVAVVTHDPRLKQYAHKTIEVRGGQVFEGAILHE